MNRSPTKRGVVLLIFVACVVVRLVALDADPPAWLSWSGGVYTDEGFYTLDARHEVLFGTWAPGNFHDRLLSPLMDLLQQGVFTAFGVGIVPARLLAVAFGLLTLAVLWVGLRRVWGERAALWGILFLGLSPPFVFYNRLALLETPTVCWLTLAWALFAAGREVVGKRRQAALFALVGVTAGVAVVFKPLALVALPGLAVGFALSLGEPAARNRRVVAALLGLAAVLALYGVVWYIPHHAEMARMGHYYRTHQYQPHSGRSVWLNVRRGVLDGERGVLPYLALLLPVPCLAAVSGIRRGRMADPVAMALAVWLAGGLAFCLLASYTPDRYYVLFLPALCGLAARQAAGWGRGWQAAALVLFLTTSGFWYVRAWVDRDWARREASQTLARTLPTGSIVVGDIAPALCLDTPFAAAPMLPELSNDDRPVERLGATHVAVIRAPDWQRWWRVHYPDIVQPSHRVAALALRGRLHLIVDVYQVRERTH